jgi:hypothetical protein
MCRPVSSTIFLVLPIPDHTFLRKPLLQHLVGQRFFRSRASAGRVFNLIAGRLTRCILGKPLLSSLKKLFRPTVIQPLGNAFTPTQCCDAFLATKSFNNNANLLFRCMLPTRLTTDVPYCLPW